MVNKCLRFFLSLGISFIMVIGLIEVSSRNSLKNFRNYEFVAFKISGLVEELTKKKHGKYVVVFYFKIRNDNHR